MIFIPQKPPQLIVIVGPCRVGTTALSTAFTPFCKVHMQPIKSARRAKEAGEKMKPWIINNGRLVVSKETIGPNTEAEFFDPIKILLKEFGYPKDKISLITIVRHPDQTFFSWNRLWKNIDLKKFIRSYELTNEIKENAKEEGIKVIPYAHEIIRDYPAALVISRLFNELGIDNLSAEAIKNWIDLKLNPEAIFYDDPPQKFIKDIGGRGGYIYKEYDSPPEVVNDRVKKIYREFYKECKISLNL